MKACIICYETTPPPIQSGCACRDDSGLAHTDCIVKVAASQAAHRGTIAWRQCQTCKQDFTGAMQIGLAEALRSWSRDKAEDSDERMVASQNVAYSLGSAIGRAQMAIPSKECKFKLLHTIYNMVC